MFCADVLVTQPVGLADRCLHDALPVAAERDVVRTSALARRIGRVDPTREPVQGSEEHEDPCGRSSSAATSPSSTSPESISWTWRRRASSCASMTALRAGPVNLSNTSLGGYWPAG
jgi:hypothetical protein